MAHENDATRILVVEDDPDIAGLVALHLKDLGYVVDKAHNGNQGLTLALTRDYSLVVLDRVLPGLDGLEICKKIREKRGAVPILFLTSKGEEIDKVLGLELGADDYMTKPFSVREFIARIKALLRRAVSAKEMSATRKEISRGNLTLDPVRCRAAAGGSEITLTATEFDLLYFLASTPGRVFSREELLNSVWGYDFAGYDHTVNAHINRLRAKIEPHPEKPIYILTVRGKGYCFTDKDRA